MTQHKWNIGSDERVSEEPAELADVIIPTRDETMMIAIGRALNPRFNGEAFVRTARRLAFERQPSHQGIH